MSLGWGVSSPTAKPSQLVQRKPPASPTRTSALNWCIQSAERLFQFDINDPSRKNPWKDDASVTTEFFNRLFRLSTVMIFAKKICRYKLRSDANPVPGGTGCLHLGKHWEREKAHEFHIKTSHLQHYSRFSQLNWLNWFWITIRVFRICFICERQLPIAPDIPSLNHAAGLQALQHRWQVRHRGQWQGRS